MGILAGAKAAPPGAAFVAGSGHNVMRLEVLAFWVAVKELKLSYYIGETLLFTIYIYTYYGTLT